MKTFHITHVTPTSCPVCGETLNAIASFDSAIDPQPDDLSVCAKCRSFLRFTAELQLVELTSDEIVALPAETRSALIRTRQTPREADIQ